MSLAEDPTDQTALLATILEKCPDLPKEAWAPQEATTEVMSRPSRLTTKFGGVDPWLAADETWPTCPECEDRPFMTFLCQLNMEEVPKEMQVK